MVFKSYRVMVDSRITYVYNLPSFTSETACISYMRKSSLLHHDRMREACVKDQPDYSRHTSLFYPEQILESDRMRLWCHELRRQVCGLDLIDDLSRGT